MSTQTIEVEKNILTFLQKRIDGAALQEIAKHVGISPSEAVKHLRGSDKFVCREQTKCLNPVWDLNQEICYDLEKAVESLNEFLYGNPAPLFVSKVPRGERIVLDPHSREATPFLKGY